MTREGYRLVGRARFQGAKLEIEADGGIRLDIPDSFPESLLAELTIQRDAVADALGDEAEEEAALRPWLPSYGAHVVELATGKPGRIWGATRHGLIVDFGGGAPLLTMNPRDVAAL